MGGIGEEMQAGRGFGMRIVYNSRIVPALEKRKMEFLDLTPYYAKRPSLTRRSH
jgi:hypothetical protein